MHHYDSTRLQLGKKTTKTTPVSYCRPIPVARTQAVWSKYLPSNNYQQFYSRPINYRNYCSYYDSAPTMSYIAWSPTKMWSPNGKVCSPKNIKRGVQNFAKSQCNEHLYSPTAEKWENTIIQSNKNTVMMPIGDGRTVYYTLTLIFRYRVAIKHCFKQCHVCKKISMHFSLHHNPQMRFLLCKRQPASFWDVFKTPYQGLVPRDSTAVSLPRKFVSQTPCITVCGAQKFLKLNYSLSSQTPTPKVSRLEL